MHKYVLIISPTLVCLLISIAKSSLAFNSKIILVTAYFFFYDLRSPFRFQIMMIIIIKGGLLLGEKLAHVFIR